jgi:hypothetical protein
MQMASLELRAATMIDGILRGLVREQKGGRS